MKKTNLLLCFLLLSIISVNAQWTENGDNKSNGNLSIGSIANNSYSKFAINGPNQPTNSGSKRDISFEFASAGKSQIRAYRGGSWDTYLQLLTTPISGGNPTVKMHLNHDGKIGIGTTNPRANLDVSTFINNGRLGTILGRLSEGNSSGTGTFIGVKGYGTQNNEYDGKSFSIIHSFYGQENSSINFFRGGSTTGGFITFNTSSNIEQLIIKNNGAVGLGTRATGSHKLAVEGSIGAREIRVEATGWSDFVFYDNYKLPTLKEVEAYIKEKGHLKDIPSTKEVEEKGIFLGEMDSKLLQKIEELTLYTIQQEKRLDNLESKNVKLEKENKALKTINSKLLELQNRLEKLEKK
jgi:hypothetical protein